MTTTNKGFLANTLRRIPRTMVKALAAGAVLVAAALPLAVASVAGATTPTLTSAFFTLASAPGTPATGYNPPFAIGAGASAVGSGPGSYLFEFTGTGFADDGANNVTVSTTAPGVTFLGAKEISTGAGVAGIVTTGAATPGSYPITVTDSNGTFTSTSNLITIDPAPTISSISPANVSDNQTSGTVTITGTGLENATGGNLYYGTLPSVVFTNATDGTQLTTGAVTTYANTTEITLASVTGTNKLTGNPATVGSYNVTVNNADFGSVTLPNAFTVTPSGIINISPSAVPATGTTNITVSGNGFEQNAVLSFASCSGGSAVNTPTNVVVVSPNTITATVTSTSGTGNCTVQVQNPSVANGGNNVLITAAHALGVGAASNTVSTVTAVSLSPNAPVVPGSSTPVTATITGTGFSAYSTVSALTSANATDSDVVFGTAGVCSVNASGTTLTCGVVASAGATAGVDSLVIENDGSAATYSTPFANALTISGPAITSVSPTALANGAPINTTLTFTGTGFTGTATVVVTHSGAASANISGVFAVTSPTTATFSLTSAASAADVGTQTFTLHEYNSSGVAVVSAPFNITVDAAPLVSGITYPTTTPATTNIGTGAVSYPVTITGTGFQAGATITKFVNTYSVADPGVTVTVSSVTSTAIKALVTVAASDANLSVGYTVTNTDQGTATVAGFGTGAIALAAGPTITAVTPASGVASGTTAFTITGTNFATGAVVTTSPANGTCGVTTLVSATTLTVSCTLGVAETTPTSLLVTNLNGGQATSAAILASATPVSVTPHTTGESGNGTAGKTVSIHVSGGGFYGQPTVTSTNGIKAVVSADSGTELTVRVTVPAKVGGEHTLTFTEPNGDVFKANFKA